MSKIVAVMRVRAEGGQHRREDLLVGTRVEGEVRANRGGETIELGTKEAGGRVAEVEPEVEEACVSPVARRETENVGEELVHAEELELQRPVENLPGEGRAARQTDGIP